jgi:hypothetical protein
MLSGSVVDTALYPAKLKMSLMELPVSEDGLATTMLSVVFFMGLLGKTLVWGGVWYFYKGFGQGTAQFGAVSG